MSDVLVIGAGIFGLTAALELRRRGATVTVLDPGPVPHPDAASTDITKAIRADYGADSFYSDLMTRALDGWDRWNATWPERVYHETGVTFLAHGPLAPGDFEYDSQTVLGDRGFLLQPLDAATIAARFPAWATADYDAGYFNPRAGWAASARVVAQLAEQAIAAGVTLRERAPVSALVERGGRVVGARAGAVYEGDTVLVAAGAWTPTLLPELADRMWATGQNVLHFVPADTTLFRPPLFATWTADISNSGWYGFPALADGTLKVAHHGQGRRVDLSRPPPVSADAEANFRAFLSARLPAAADADLVGGRVCVYCDTFDGHFWIDRHPERPGLAVAAGGSGHGFKFAPILGELIADALDGRARAHFGWRSLSTLDSEAARSDAPCR